MKGCQETLRMSTSEYDPRIQIRNGFQKTLDNIANHLTETFEMITTITDEHNQSVRTLSEKAAKLWMLFGTQRCRLFFVLQSKDDLVGSDISADDRVVHFIIRPDLKRAGDADGNAGQYTALRIAHNAGQRAGLLCEDRGGDEREQR